MMLRDSIHENIELIGELLAGMPADARERAKRAAVRIENIIVKIQKDSPKDPAVAIGVAFAVHIVAQRLVEKAADKEADSVIQLLS